VLGLGVHGLAIARSLGRRGIHVEAVDTEIEQPHRFSRYCRALHRVESLEDDRLFDYLVGYGRGRRDRAALFITKDGTVPVVSAHRDALSGYFCFNLPPAAVVRELMDKSALPVFLERAGCAYPRTLRITRPSDLERAAEIVGFPCIVKPTSRTYGFKAGVANSLPELQRLHAHASRHTNELIAQQLIAGEDTDVYFCFAYIGRDAVPRAVFTGRKVRQLPRGTGIAASAVGCEDDFVRRETLRLFEVAGYRGFGSAEFRRDPATGEYYLIEFSVGRTDYNVGCAIAGGIDVPFLGYQDMVGAECDTRLHRQRNGRRWVELDRDVRAIWRDGATTDAGHFRKLAALANSLSPRNAFALFDAGDPVPFLMNLFGRCVALPKAALRRASRLVRSG
jgi:predicted ATP-grasp superfamily ATP-dependent carboligase